MEDQKRERRIGNQGEQWWYWCFKGTTVWIEFLEEEPIQEVDIEMHCLAAQKVKENRRFHQENPYNLINSKELNHKKSTCSHFISSSFALETR